MKTDIKKKVLETIEEYRMFSPGDLVLVAVSGGADSTALLHLLQACREELQIELQVIHLNHLLRRGDAEMDARYVEGLARKLGLPVTVGTLDVAALALERKAGLEEAARFARYDFFAKTAESLKAAKIAVGHTADDNIETFLMRLLRGSGLKGLCGIPPRRGKIVRPLIKIWRREIEDYVGALKLVPRRDHTNYESKYLRNSIRLKLIPQLKIYNLNIKEIILQTILLLTDDRSYLESQAQTALEGVVVARDVERLELSLSKLQAQEQALIGHILRQAIEEVKGDLTQLSYGHIRDLLAKLKEKERWEIHLPGGLYVLGEGGRWKISREKPDLVEEKSFSYTLSLPGEVRLEEIGKTIRASFVDLVEKEGREEVAFVDHEALGRELLVRSRRPGDRFFPLGLKGSKKLQDYFIDQKVPAVERWKVPVVESAGRIVWLAGKRLDERAKITPRTKRIVKLELL